MLQGEANAAELWPEVYDYLRRVAHRYCRGGRGGATLGATGLVHEAYLRLFADAARAPRCRDQEHLCALAARVMRNVLIDGCRRRLAAKRGGGDARVSPSAIGTPPSPVEDLLALDEALTDLAAVDGRMARVVELRTFGGMTGDEIAAELEVSRRTVESDWRRARAWLAARLGVAWRFE